MLKYAAVFPGQGSQSLGMLAELEAQFPVVGETFQEASEILSRDLWAITQSDSPADLNATENTQPIMLAAGVALWRVWSARGGNPPTVMAGHSLGEYTALVCSGALGFSSAVKLVAERARQMQAAVPEGQGGMAAILGLDDNAVIDVCAEASQGQVVAAVNFNSPGQVVIAGAAEAVDRAILGAKQAGAKRALKLPVSVPSHCELMRPAANALADTLQETSFSTPEIPVIHNVDVRSHEEAADIRSALMEQLYQPVRWGDTVRSLVESGVTRLLEFGPGKVLAGLTRRIDRSLQAQCIQDQDSLEKALADFTGETS
jgi:[acyl-carrier-protein] S-malonyltransferase